jgi:hypothetical protein
MKQNGVSLHTSLTTKQLADSFQSSTSSLYGKGGKLGARLRGQSGLNYFTPQDDSPFSALDDDKPAFSVGAVIPKYSGGGGGNMVIHMYVWDRGEQREVALVSPHTMGGGSASKKTLDTVLGGFRNLDRQLVVS